MRRLEGLANVECLDGQQAFHVAPQARIDLRSEPKGRRLISEYRLQFAQ
jgi:hypothetical protein